MEQIDYTQEAREFISRCSRSNTGHISVSEHLLATLLQRISARARQEQIAKDAKIAEDEAEWKTGEIDWDDAWSMACVNIAASIREQE